MAMLPHMAASYFLAALIIQFTETGSLSAIPAGTVANPVDHISGSTYSLLPMFLDISCSISEMLSSGEAHTVFACNAVILIPVRLVGCKSIYFTPISQLFQ